MSAPANWEDAFRQLRRQMFEIETEVMRAKSLAGLMGHLVGSPHQIEGHELEPILHLLHGLANRLEAFWKAAEAVSAPAPRLPEETIERARH
jgi:hypothetical protein